MFACSTGPPGDQMDLQKYIHVHVYMYIVYTDRGHVEFDRTACSARQSAVRFLVINMSIQ